MDFIFAGQPASSRRISFFLNFIDSFGYSRTEFFKSVGLRSTLINNWMNSDDVSISYLFLISKRINYRCFIYIEPKDPKEAKDYRSKAFRTMQSGSEFSSNLDFLKDFVEIEKISAASLCARISKSRSRLNYWYSVDDIALKTIYSICQAYNRNLHVVFKPVETDEHCAGSEVIYEVYRNHCYPFGKEFTCDL